ncbi:MAG: enoyl-CoA hydratase-related protein, partial [Planctomycetaceae bacterium]
TKLNAWTPQMELEIYDAAVKADRDDAVKVIIVTGAGRGFCAGADMEVLSWVTSVDWKNYNREEQREKICPPRDVPGALPDFSKTYSYFPALSKPTIAAINGPAVGLGLVFTLYCDIRIASEQARFGTAFARRGLIAEHGLSWMLPRLVGVSNALDLLYSARMIDSAEALRQGLVSQVVPNDDLIDTVRNYAGELAANVSPRSMRVIKRQVYGALFQTLGEAIEDANDEMFESFGSSDFREGVAHFLEKRPPKFSGK